jgi:uncharacterized protein with ATP-grasp and redox domains
LEIGAECIPCVLNIRCKDLEIIEMNDKEKYEYMIKILEKLYSLLLENKKRSPCELLTELFRLTKKITKLEDPYLYKKKEEIRIALRMYDDLRLKLNSVNKDERLNMAIKIAAVGNTIDSPLHNYALENLYNDISYANFIINDASILNTVKDKKIVYLLDNCGEAIFDRILVEELRKIGAYVVGIVKGKSFQNDITLKEIEEAGIKDAFDKIIDTSSDAASIFWNEISERVKEEILDADIMIAKGLAHFEYLIDNRLKIPCKKLCIFKVKCERISEFLKIPLYSYVAKLI